MRLEKPLIGSEVISMQRMSADRNAPGNPILPPRLRQKFVQELRRSALLRRFKRALPSARREYLSYGPDQYLPQLEHFLTLLTRGTRESDVVPLDLSLAIQRVIDQARADHRRWPLEKPRI